MRYTSPARAMIVQERYNSDCVYPDQKRKNIIEIYTIYLFNIQIVRRTMTGSLLSLEQTETVRVAGSYMITAQVLYFVGFAIMMVAQFERILGALQLFYARGVRFIVLIIEQCMSLSR